MHIQNYLTNQGNLLVSDDSGIDYINKHYIWKVQLDAVMTGVLVVIRLIKACKCSNNIRLCNKKYSDNYTMKRIYLKNRK